MEKVQVGLVQHFPVREVEVVTAGVVVAKFVNQIAACEPTDDAGVILSCCSAAGVDQLASAARGVAGVADRQVRQARVIQPGRERAYEDVAFGAVAVLGRRTEVRHVLIDPTHVPAGGIGCTVGRVGLRVAGTGSGCP